MQAIIITIGDEILIGQIIDSNSAWIATQLNLEGINIREVISISDEHEAIMEAVTNAFERADLILMTGGLGPTKDDITKKALADYFNVGMRFDEGTWERIQKLFTKLGRDWTPAHKEQCLMPENAQLLLNKMGTAPGMWFEQDGKKLVSMPGVPYEMKYLMEFEVLPKLKARHGKIAIAHRTILTVGEGESRIAARLEDFENNLPQGFKLAYLPGLGRVRLRISGRLKDEELLLLTIEDLKQKLIKIIPELVFGFEKEELAEVVGKMVKVKNIQLVTAESCTGGYVGHLITQISGSSDYFKGGIIAYSNAIKQELLDVSKATLDDYGAVSEQTVTEMVSGALKNMSADLAVAISGIAGPGGGTPDKPVGTIWLAVGDKNRTTTKKLSLFKDRLKNIQYAGVVALNMIRIFLLEGK